MQDKVDMEVVKVPKSGGTVAVPRDQKRTLNDRSIYRYFYGTDLDLQPTLHYFSLDKVTICKVATSASAQSGVLPSGMQNSVDGTRLMIVEPSQDMVCNPSRVHASIVHRLATAAVVRPSSMMP